MKHLLHHLLDHPRLNGPAFRRTVLLAWCGLIALGASHAQDCNLACDGTPDAPLQVTVTQNCSITLVPDNVLEGPEECPGQKNIVVRDLQSNLIVQGVDEVFFDGSPFIDQVLSVTTTDIASGLFCVSFIRVVDNLPPTITCMPVSVNCLSNTSPGSITGPSFSDNCSDEDLQLSFSDFPTPGSCLTDYVKVIDRNWTVTDPSGNTAHCVQTITVRRPELEEVAFPPNVTLTCGSLDTNPSATGMPTLQGVPFMNGDVCGLTVAHSDEHVEICGNIEFQILRTWTVTNQCTDFSTSQVQVITVQDTEAPVITCPAPFTVNTTAGQCTATVNLEQATATDNCGPTPQIFISTSYGAVGLGPHPFVPSGTHTIQYTAEDQCGNTSVCSTTITVVDNEEPVAICEDQVIVSVPTGGLAQVMAATFDEGSFDNCSGTVYFKVKRMTAGQCNGANGDDSDVIPGYQEWFDDKVLFCCEDIGNGQVTVTLRVYSVNPGAGPVNPNREQPGGDLYGTFADCMVQTTVGDQLPPVFQNCPANTTVDCHTDLSNLAAFGNPVVTDNCSYTVEADSTEEINDCGEGTIIRTFSAVDPSGNISHCSQTITVVNNDPLLASHITWPLDYTTDVCGTTVDPEDLPAGYDVPVINYDGCGSVMVNHTDEIYDIAPPACFKILRLWTVIDWCNFDPDHPEAGGKYADIQVIKIQDHVNPVITCPANIEVNVSNNCTNAAVTLGNAVAEDCSPNVLVTNNSPYAASTGANASGTYPLGTTVVTFTASDRCGNTSTCSTEIRVEDNTPPSPLCIVGLSASLSNMNGQVMAMVPATAFNAGSTDNCTPTGQLGLTIKRSVPGSIPTPATTTSVNFTCADLGTQLVELWATDQAGNADYCLTYITIQDNSGVCPNMTTSAMIAGAITTSEGDNVEGVSIQITGTSSQQMMTGLDGFFEFPNIPLGGDYSVAPYNNSDLLNGVSTIDLVLMSKHILGIQPFDSPYKILAADIDRSGNVSTMDLIRLRKVILHIDNEFPNGNTSWRFIDAGFIFPNPSNPFATYFPEIYNINDLYDDEMHVDFIAIKVGDVNMSAVPNSNVTSNRSVPGKMNLQVENRDFGKDEEVTVDIMAEDAGLYETFQFTLYFDPAVLEWEGLDPGSNIPNMDENNFGTTELDQGLLTVSWNESGSSRVQEGAVLFSLKFRATGPGKLNELMTVSGKLTQAEASTRDGEVRTVQLNFTDKEPTDGYALYQNQPNPFRDQTIIGFDLQEAGPASLQIFDISGKAVYQAQGQFNDGYNEFTVNRSDLPAAGLYYYLVESGRWRETKKMLLTD